MTGSEGTHSDLGARADVRPHGEGAARGDWRRRTWPVRLRWKSFWEWFWMTLAWHAPRPLVYWTTVRMVASASVSPALANREMGAITVDDLGRWMDGERRHVVVSEPAARAEVCGMCSGEKVIGASVIDQIVCPGCNGAGLVVQRIENFAAPTVPIDRSPRWVFPKDQ